jgi:hypothetical protein
VAERALATLPVAEGAPVTRPGALSVPLAQREALVGTPVVDRVAAATPALRARRVTADPRVTRGKTGQAEAGVGATLAHLRDAAYR